MPQSAWKSWCDLCWRAERAAPEQGSGRGLERCLGAPCNLLAQGYEFPSDAWVFSVAHTWYLILGCAAAQSLGGQRETLPKPLSAQRSGVHLCNMTSVACRARKQQLRPQGEGLPRQRRVPRTQAACQQPSGVTPASSLGSPSTAAAGGESCMCRLHAVLVTGMLNSATALRATD